MTLNDFLFGALLYLAAAVASAPIAGAIIGPSVLNLAGETGSVMHFAEFGVVMMLFLVGLELQPSKLWDLRKRIFGLGLLQVLGVTAALALASLPFTQFWQESLVIGLVLAMSSLAMSSTAIVLQSMAEQGHNTVVLDQDSSQVETLRKFGFKVFHGDAFVFAADKSSETKDSK